jgi:hypothetical protein
MGTFLSSRSFKVCLLRVRRRPEALDRGVPVAVEITNRVSDQIGDAKALVRAEVTEIFSRIGEGDVPASRASASANALLSN